MVSCVRADDVGLGPIGADGDVVRRLREDAGRDRCAERQSRHRHWIHLGLVAAAGGGDIRRRAVRGERDRIAARHPDELHPGLRGAARDVDLRDSAGAVKHVGGRAVGGIGDVDRRVRDRNRGAERGRVRREVQRENDVVLQVIDIRAVPIRGDGDIARRDAAVGRRRGKRERAAGDRVAGTERVGNHNPATRHRVLARRVGGAAARRSPHAEQGPGTCREAGLGVGRAIDLDETARRTDHDAVGGRRSRRATENSHADRHDQPKQPSPCTHRHTLHRSHRRRRRAPPLAQRQTFSLAATALSTPRESSRPSSEQGGPRHENPRDLFIARSAVVLLRP